MTRRLTRKQEKAVFAKGKPAPRTPAKVSLRRAAATTRKPRKTREVTPGMPGADRVLFTTGPHAEQKVVLVEDQRIAADRIYELTDSQGRRFPFLGSEWASLAKGWAKERRRKGINEDPADSLRDTYPVPTMRDGKVVTVRVTVPEDDRED